MGVGIIGVGFIGEYHAKTLFDLECAELLAVADIDTKQSRNVGTKFGVDYYTDYDDLLKRDDIEAVVICTPEDLHLKPAIAASEARKHLLIEKPIAHESDAARKIIDCSKKSGVRLMVAHVLRYTPDFVRINKIVNDQRIGKVIHFLFHHDCPVDRPRRLKGRTSVVFYLGVHDVDFMRWCLGDIEYVSAEARTELLKEIDTYDSVFSLLKFRNKSLGMIENNWVNPMSYEPQVDMNLTIVGTEGLIKYSSKEGLILWEEDSVSEMTCGVRHGKPLNSFALQDEHFVKSIWNDKQFRTTGEDALAAVEICSAIHESIREGKRVAIPRR